MDGDSFQLLSTLSDRSASSERTERDVDAGGAPVTSARDLPRRDVASHLPPAPNIAPPRSLDPAPCIQHEFRAPTSVELRPPRSHRLAWTLASSVIAVGTTAAFWLSFSERLLSGIPPPQPYRLAAAVSLVATPEQTLQLDSSVASAHGHLVVQDQRGLVNQPLPLGISLTGGFGGEIVVLEGLAEGTTLSAGTSLSSNRWSLPAKDADETFVSAPQDFSGTMEAIARLYSPGNESLQTAKIRLEWARSPVIKATDAASLAPAPQASVPIKSEPPPVTIADLNQPTTGQVDPKPVSQTKPPQSEEAQAFNRPRPAQDPDALLQVGERMLREGDFAAARVALRRAAEAGSAEAAPDLGMSFDPSFLRRIGAAQLPISPRLPSGP